MSRPRAERASLEEVLPFRAAQLRPPGFAPEARPADGHPLVAHFVVRRVGEGVRGGLAGGQVDGAGTGLVVACASVDPEGPAGHWQLRAVATRADARRAGAGRAVVEACLGHARAHGGTFVWCHGRTGARAFYEALGFRAVGEEYVVPVSGPHYRMERAL